MDERALGGTAEGVDVAGERASPGAGLAAHEDRYVGEPGIERAQELGHLEVRKPAREARADRLAAGARRERERWGRRPRGHVSDHRAQQRRIRGVADEARGDRVEEPPRLRGELRLEEQDPGAVAQSALRTARKLELDLEVAREAQQHDPRRRRRVEARIAGSADDRLVGGSQPHEGRAQARVAMDDPQGRHGGSIRS